MKYKGAIFNDRVKFISVIAIVILAIVTIVLVNNKDNKSNVSEYTEIAETHFANEEKNAKEELKTGTITIHYLDENGKAIDDPDVESYKVGEFYKVEKKQISGYTIYEEPITKTGYCELGNIDVNFIYRSSIEEVKYNVKNEGDNDSTENAVSVVFNNTKSKREYGVKIVTKDENGKKINGGEFEYKQNGKVLKKGIVSNGQLYVGSIFINEEGNIIYQVNQTKATIGYEKLPNEIDLTLKSVWDDEKKQYKITEVGDSSQLVNAYINEKDEVVIEVTNKKIKDMYEIEIINKNGNELLEGTKIKVESIYEEIINDYVKNGKLYVGEFGITDPGSDMYTIYETETKEGYYTVISKENPGKVQVSKKFNQETNSFEITASCNGVEGLSVEVLEGSNKVTIYIESKKIADKYDLCIKKFISEIDGIDTDGREPVVTKTEDGKYVYTQNGEIEKAANEQIVTYRLRTYNESKKIAKGKRIIEYIPDGLVFLPDNEKNKEYKWEPCIVNENGNINKTSDMEKANAVVSDYLVDKEILAATDMPEHEDIEVVFVVDEDKITSEDRIIENKVKIEKNDNDDNPDNDESSEKLYVKSFDLKMKKYIKEVKIKNEKGEKVRSVGENQKGKLVKIDVAKSQINKTELTITYVLKVMNVGEIEGYATELVDHIPQDFILNGNEVWKLKEENAISTKLENKLIKPGESAELEVTFTWKLTEDNVGSRINTGDITAYENPYNAVDRTKDNNDSEELLVTITTGGVWFSIIPIVLLTIAGVIIYMMRKKNK